MGPARAARPYGNSRVSAPTASQAARFDREAVIEVGAREPALMENAGRQAALLTHRLVPAGEILGLVGPGNNGGDALVALRALAAWGRRVRAVLVGRRRGDDATLHGWPLPTLRFDPDVPGAAEAVARALGGASAVLDGLLGTGLRGAPRPPFSSAIELVADANALVVALDAPSGVDGDDGGVAGAAVRADVTVAFGWPKLGTMLYPGRRWCGRIVAVEIGFPPAAEERPGWARLATPGWASDALPARSPPTHKNAVGAVAVVAGSAMPGAAVLAARSAFRCGVGAVRLCVAGSRWAGEAIRSVPEAIPVDAADERALAAAVDASDALVIGPGMGTGAAAARQLAVALEARGPRPAVLDADALTLWAKGKGSAGASENGGSARGLVVTPHPGEMARLVGQSVARVQEDRVAVAKEFSASRGVVTVLKGTPTLATDPAGRMLVSVLERPSALAVAGMGDALAGAVGAFLAQGAGGLRAAGLALHATGQAASIAACGRSLTPSDVVAAIPEALARRGCGATDLPFPFVTFDQSSPA